MAMEAGAPEALVTLFLLVSYLEIIWLGTKVALCQK
jgi:hypothetical protein